MRALKIAFVAAFLAVTVLPTLQMIVPLVNLSLLLPLEEKRTLEPAPDFVGKLLHGDGRLSANINRCFDDRTGFRPLFVRLQHQLDYWLFGHSEKIYIGRQGWLYQPGFFCAKILWERRRLEMTARVHERFFELAKYLARRDIRLIIISNPDKMIAYPQFLPYWAPRLPPYDGFQALRAFLKERTEWIYIDGQDLLERQCTERRTFQLVDIHMTFPGGVCFTKELVARVLDAERWPASPWDHVFTYTTGLGYHGGQGDFLALLYPPTQPIEIPSPLYGLDDIPPEGSFSIDPERKFEFIFHAHDRYLVKRLPGMALFGDSFLDMYRVAGVFSYFSDIYKVRNDGENLGITSQRLPTGTRYFVYQFIAPYWTSIEFQKTAAP